MVSHLRPPTQPRTCLQVRLDRRAKTIKAPCVPQLYIGLDAQSTALHAGHNVWKVAGSWLEPQAQQWNYVPTRTHVPASWARLYRLRVSATIRPPCQGTYTHAYGLRRSSQSSWHSECQQAGQQPLNRISRCRARRNACLVRIWCVFCSIGLCGLCLDVSPSGRVAAVSSENRGIEE